MKINSLKSGVFAVIAAIASSLLMSCSEAPPSAETPAETAETETVAEGETAETETASDEAASGSQCETVGRVTREPYTSSLIFTPTLEENEDGGISRVTVSLLEQSVEDAKEEIGEIDARIQTLSDLELTYPGLAEFRDGYVGQLEEIKGMLITADEELSALVAAFQTLDASDPSAEEIAQASELIQASLNKDLPANQEALSEKSIALGPAALGDFLQICPPEAGSN